MLNKNMLIQEKILELEMWLLENFSVMRASSDELPSLLKANGFSQSEIEYLLSAYYIPTVEIQKQLLIYNTEKPHMDGSKFIDSLQAKYNVDRNVIMKRIRYVRILNEYLRKNPNIVFPKVEIYNKLVRDKIPEIIEANGEVAIYSVLGDEEYWNYLLAKDREELEEVRSASSPREIKGELCDKLEVIIAMANYHGFTLEDIIEEANLKREAKGSFEKKLFLKRTYKCPNKGV